VLSYKNLLSVLLAGVTGYRDDLVALLGFCHVMCLPLDLSRQALRATGYVGDATLTPCTPLHDKRANSTKHLSDSCCVCYGRLVNLGQRSALQRMAITINGTAINLDWTTILIWCLVGLVAGFLASRVALGHGLGLFGDIVVGILGAFLGGFLAALLHIKVEVFGYPIISKMVVAFAGAVILLLVVRVFSGGGMRRRRAT